MSFVACWTFDVWEIPFNKYKVFPIFLVYCHRLDILCFACVKWHITFGNICSCRLRVALLSSRTAVVAGCELPNLHGNGNYHIFFVSNWVSVCSMVKCFKSYLTFCLLSFFVRTVRRTIYFERGQP